MTSMEQLKTFAPDVDRPLAMLSACPVYVPTPLRRLKDEDGRDLLIKDETGRMGLGAFKALGGVYAVVRLIAEFWRASANPAIEPEDLMRDDVKAAEVVRSGATYEESIAAAIEDANANGAVHLADGSWPGYTHAPALVMEGYTVIGEELRAEFERDGDWPTHVFLQAGVGGLAAAIAWVIRERWSVQPRIVIVEPDAAPCIAASLAAGAPATVSGPVSNMGRLDCKEPSMLAFEAIGRCDVECMAVSDDEASAAAGRLTELGLATTPSGAAGYAALRSGRFSGAEDAGRRSLIIVSEGAV
jgi:diaminopropionate ammonia-lyase